MGLWGAAEKKGRKEQVRVRDLPFSCNSGSFLTDWRVRWNLLPAVVSQQRFDRRCKELPQRGGSWRLRHGCARLPPVFARQGQSYERDISVYRAVRQGIARQHRHGGG